MGGDDPSFYDSIARLQSKYNLESKRAQMSIPHPVIDQPKTEDGWMLPYPSKPILP